MSTVAELPHRLRSVVSREFQGEAILWAGRPSATRSFLVAMLIWLFAVPWTAFSLGWEVMALSGWLSGKPSPSSTQALMGIVFPLFGLPFVLIGFAMLASPFLAWIWARRTVYVLSGKRLATITVGRHLKVKSIPIANFTRTERSEANDGSGTLKVGTGFRRDSDGDKVEMIESLLGIRDVRKVEQLIMARIEHERWQRAGNQSKAT